MKVLNIVARNDEDLSWAYNIKGNVAVYNNGDNFPYSFIHYDVKSLSGISETFTRAIIEYYSVLNQYNHICFLQGNPFFYCSKLEEILKENNSDFRLLSDKSLTTSFKTLNSDLYISNKNIKVFEKLISQNNKNFHNDELMNIMFVMDFINLPYKNLELFSALGSQYKVPVELILSKSLDWWKNLFDLIHFCYFYLNWKDIDPILEKIWPAIWNYKCYG